MSDETKRQVTTLAIFCKYLLMEKKQETQLSMAYALFAQERHNMLHTKDHKNGDGTDFSDCKNDKCRMAFNVLKDSRQMAVEVNDITIQMVERYNLKVENTTGTTARAWLEPKPEIVKPKNIAV